MSSNNKIDEFPAATWPYKIFLMFRDNIAIYFKTFSVSGLRYHCLWIETKIDCQYEIIIKKIE